MHCRSSAACSHFISCAVYMRSIDPPIMVTFRRSTSIVATLMLIFLAVSSFSTLVEAKKSRSKPSQLKVGFYTTTCPQAETIVKNAVAARAKQDPTIIPALVRMYFHDCFANGQCDASLLLKSTPGTSAEIDSEANQTLRGLDFIDFIKSLLEKACKGKVSCADIIALATRDAVALAKGMSYDIPTGRKDGKVSLKAFADTLPTSHTPIAATLALFAQKGFTANEMVVLIGAHTIGKVHCGFFVERLYNFFNTNKPDPQMNSTLVTELRKVCPNQPGVGNSTFLDRGTATTVDQSYFQQLLIHKGVMQSDQDLTADLVTNPLVEAFAHGTNSNFQHQFAAAMVKLGNLGVITNSQGEIRNVCSQIN